MDYTTIPNETNELIKWLDVMYPDRCPNPEDSEREVWMKAGERRVVNTLIAKLTATEDMNLKGEQ
jgi:hypothetical protein